MPRKSPGARERGLGAEARILRTSTGLTLTAAAGLMGWTKSTLSKLENGQRGITPEELYALATVYGITDGRRDSLVNRAKSDDEAGIWERTLPGIPQEAGTLASFESEATRMVNWEPLLIPGLLQTVDYSRAWMKSDGIPDDQIEPRLMARARRQQRLRGGVEFVALIGEGALRAPVGGPQVMAAQLREIVIAAQRPNVSVRVVPVDRVHAGQVGAFLLLEFPAARPVAHIELLRGATFLERDVAERYVVAATQVISVSLPATESVRAIEAMAAQMEGQHASQVAEVDL
jgi:transcriptional regulator with XRE-family HTH domain